MSRASPAALRSAAVTCGLPGRAVPPNVNCATLCSGVATSLRSGAAARNTSLGVAALASFVTRKTSPLALSTKMASQSRAPPG